MEKYNYGCAGLTAVISGGTSGIGEKTAEFLLRDGATVFILGRSVKRGQKSMAKLKELTGRDAHYICCDVKSAKSCKDALAQLNYFTGAEKISIDILINSAGVYAEQDLADFTEEHYAEIMDVNVKGMFLLTQAALPYLERGVIINIASDAGVKGNFGCPVYCASKGAVVALTRALALDLAPDVRVNCVAPADVDTPLLAKQLAETCNGYSITDMATTYPLGRIGRPQEVAHVICAAASPLNSFMTGSIICVDGGISAGG